MVKVNDNFQKLPGAYLFSEVARKVEAYQKQHPEASVISMGIGDVTLPICTSAIEAMHRAVDELANGDTFRGYGPETGYSFLIETIIENDYNARGIELHPDEVFISDGAKSDTGNIGDLFSRDCKVAVTDPVYPVYVDTNVMAGRAGSLGKDGRWSHIIYLPTTLENSFVPALPHEVPDIIYLCYPNNPTGTVLTRQQLKQWVDYAIANGALILFDSAYEAYVVDEDVPRSIYEIEGAREVAIEFRSFSKTAGFTGVRCGYTIVPRGLLGYDKQGNRVNINNMWCRRQTTKFNGASYISQCGAAALYTPEGEAQVHAMVDYYRTNAKMLKSALQGLGLPTVGGDNSPYLWMKTPGDMKSWEFFDFLLDRVQVVGTPGAGFGPSGQGYIRFTGFASKQNTLKAIERLKTLELETLF